MTAYTIVIKARALQVIEMQLKQHHRLFACSPVVLEVSLLSSVATPCFRHRSLISGSSVSSFVMIPGHILMQEGLLSSRLTHHASRVLSIEVCRRLVAQCQAQMLFRPLLSRLSVARILNASTRLRHGTG